MVDSHSDESSGLNDPADFEFRSGIIELEVEIETFEHGFFDVDLFGVDLGDGQTEENSDDSRVVAGRKVRENIDDGKTIEETEEAESEEKSSVIVAGGVGLLVINPSSN